MLWYVKYYVTQYMFSSWHWKYRGIDVKIQWKGQSMVSSCMTAVSDMPWSSPDRRFCFLSSREGYEFSGPEAAVWIRGVGIRATLEWTQIRLTSTAGCTEHFSYSLTQDQPYFPPPQQKHYIIYIIYYTYIDIDHPNSSRIVWSNHGKSPPQETLTHQPSNDYT